MNYKILQSPCHNQRKTKPKHRSSVWKTKYSLTLSVEIKINSSQMLLIKCTWLTNWSSASVSTSNCCCPFIWKGYISISEQFEVHRFTVRKWETFKIVANKTNAANHYKHIIPIFKNSSGGVMIWIKSSIWVNHERLCVSKYS